MYVLFLLLEAASQPHLSHWYDFARPIVVIVIDYYCTLSETGKSDHADWDTDQYTGASNVTIWRWKSEIWRRWLLIKKGKWRSEIKIICTMQSNPWVVSYLPTFFCLLLLKTIECNCSLFVSICMQRLHGGSEKTVLPDACPKYYRKRSYTKEAGKQKS